MLSRFHLIPERYGRTDRQTDRFAVSISRVSMLTRDKNEPKTYQLAKLEKLAAASGRRRWPICWCCLDRGPGSFDVEDATALSWSSAAVSE